jgi:hypothetical protein
MPQFHHRETQYTKRKNAHTPASAFKDRSGGAQQAVMNIQRSVNMIPVPNTKTQQPWYISDDSVTVLIALPKEIVWARLSEALKRTITRKGSFLEPRAEFSGHVDGDDLEISCRIGGRTGTEYIVNGELAGTPDGTQVFFAIHENRLWRLGKNVLNLSIMALVYYFLTGLRGSFLTTSTLVSTLIFAVIMCIPMLISAGWHRDRVLTRTSEVFKSIADGRYYETV